ncbi:MAG TPA: hypothetical protein VJV04_01970 [Nitrospiraceae bacterium]|nr:hypothetical protein [Nitrospiraceae bacterium]
MYIRSLIASVVILSTGVGCLGQMQTLHRLHGDATTPRCNAQMKTHLLPTPRGGDADNYRGDPVAEILPARVREVAAAINVLGLLGELRRLEREVAERSEVTWRLLKTRQQISHRIALAAFDVTSTVAELDCEESRADHVADGLRERLQERADRDLFLVFAGDLWIGIIAGSLSLAGQGTASAANAIFGGLFATGIGSASAFADETYAFHHPRNHLHDVREGPHNSTLFPASVWRYLNGPSWILPGETIRQALLEHWKEEGRLGEPNNDTDKKRNELFFGEGGIYRIKDLRLRAEMLDHLKSEVLRMGQDLNNLLYEVLTHDPEPLQRLRQTHANFSQADRDE